MPRRNSSKSTSKSRSRGQKSPARPRRRQSVRSSTVIALSSNAKKRSETVATIRRDKQVFTRSESVAAVARVDDGDKTVVRFAVPHATRGVKSHSRTRSRRSRSRSRSKRAQYNVDVPVKMIAQSDSGNELGLTVGGEAAVLNRKDSTIETREYLIGVQRVHDGEKATTIEVTVAKKPDVTHKPGWFARQWKNWVITALIAIILALLGSRGGVAKPCIVHYTAGFPFGSPNAVTEIITPQLGLLAAGFKFANLQVVTLPTLFHRELPRISNVLPPLSIDARPSPAASLPFKVVQLMSTYNLKYELAKRELETMFSAAALDQLNHEIIRSREDVSGWQQTTIAHQLRSDQEKNNALEQLRGQIRTLEAETGQLRGNVSQQVDTIKGFQDSMDAMRSVKLDQTVTITGLESTVAHLNAKIKAYATLQVRYDELVESLEIAEADGDTSAAEAVTFNNYLIEATAQLDRYKDVVIPALKEDLRAAKEVIKMLKAEATARIQTENEHKRRYERAEASLIKLGNQKDISRADVESQLQVTRIELDNMRHRNAALVDLARIVDAIILQLGEMGIALPSVSENESSLQAVLSEYSNDAADISDRLQKGIADVVAFHSRHIARLETRAGKDDYDIESALGAGHREQLLREHKSALNLALSTKKDLVSDRLKQTRLLTAQAEMTRFWQTKFVTLRATDKSITELVAPTIFATKRPDGSYVVEHNTETLLRVAPGLKSSIDELRTCVESKLNGKRSSVTPASISCTVNTRIFLATGSKNFSREFRMKLLGTSDLAGGKAPIQRFEYFVDEQEAPKIIVETEVKTVVVKERTVETVTTLSTVTETYTTVPPVPTPSTTSSSLSVPMSAPWITPTPTVTESVQKLIAATLHSGETRVVSHTTLPRPASTPLVAPGSAPEGIVELSQGSNGKGTFVLEVKRTAIDVCDGAHPLSEYFSLLDTCGVNEVGQGMNTDTSPKDIVGRSRWFERGELLVQILSGLGQALGASPPAVPYKPYTNKAASAEAIRRRVAPAPAPASISPEQQYTVTPQRIRH